MAGGMGRGTGLPLWLRGGGQPPTQPAQCRHCFALVDQVPTEGLVLRWRRDPTGAWTGLVTYVDEHDAPVTQWMPAALLRPAR